MDVLSNINDWWLLVLAVVSVLFMAGWVLYMLFYAVPQDAMRLWRRFRSRHQGPHPDLHHPSHRQDPSL